MRDPLDSRKAVVLWNLALALSVCVSFGCFGAAGAFMLNEGLGLSHEPTLVVMIDRSVPVARVEVYETSYATAQERRLPALAAFVNGRPLVAVTDRLAAPAPAGGAFVVTLKPGLLEAYDLRLWAPRVTNFRLTEAARRELRVRFHVQGAAEARRRVRFELRATSEEGYEYHFSHIGGAGVREGANQFIVPSSTKALRYCLDAVPRYKPGHNSDDTLLGAHLDARVRLACVEPQAD